MHKKIWLKNIWLSMALIVLLSACGAPTATPQQPNPDDLATIVVGTMQASPSETAPAPSPQGSDSAESTPAREPTVKVSDAGDPATIQETQPPVIYTADGSTCERTGVAPLGGGGGGQAVLPPFDPGEALVMQVDSPDLVNISSLLFHPGSPWWT